MNIHSWACGQDNLRPIEEKIKEIYKNTVPIIKPENLIKKLNQGQEIIIIDTRTEEEYNISHIKTALWINYDSFNPELVKDFGKNEELVLYCSIGYRSERLGEILIQMGFTNVYNLYGGIFEWFNKENEVVNSNGNKTNKIHSYSGKWAKFIERGDVVY
ncbi:MAG: rhodanese-like domain-containing protein [Bacteroidia bacterium]|nr:rhodanese-like domain-containing protein [Bacteroidia bacterium]